jgi:hypothetical protein
MRDEEKEQGFSVFFLTESVFRIAGFEKDSIN